MHGHPCYHPWSALDLLIQLAPTIEARPTEWFVNHGDFIIAIIIIAIIIAAEMSAGPT